MPPKKKKSVKIAAGRKGPQELFQVVEDARKRFRELEGSVINLRKEMRATWGQMEIYLDHLRIKIDELQTALFENRGESKEYHRSHRSH